MSGSKNYTTIKDVAMLANTSIATVSYILNGSETHTISPETRKRVLDAAEELNYSKSAVASSLKGKKRGLIAIFIPQFGNVYYIRALESIADIAFANDLIPFSCDTREDPNRERKLLESAVSQRVDGIILGPTHMGWKNTEIIRSTNIPLVVIGRELMPPPGVQNDTYYVSDDSYQAGYLAGSCLAQRGHKRIGVIEWDGEVSSAFERKRGFEDAIHAMIRSGSEIEVESSPVLSVETGYTLTKRLLKRFNPTALFFGYHRHAEGGALYLRELGLNVPNDISVVLVGTPKWAQLSNPAYTTINQREDWVGTTAGNILLALIKNEMLMHLLTERKHICPCEIINNGSVKDLTNA